MSMKKILPIVAIMGCVTVPSTDSYAADKLVEAFQSGTAYMNFRYRYENVDQMDKAGITDDAHASTLRTNFGYETGDFYGLSGKVEVQNITHLGGTAFNDTTNSKTTRPVVADAEITELNEAYLKYSAFDTTIKAGRQKINLGNLRFIGTVGWRQNDQTHDGVSVVNTSIPDTKVFYGYSTNVNRVFGDDSVSKPGDLETDTHMANITYSGLKDTLGEVTGYYYKMNFDESAGLNSETFGLNLKGSHKLNEDFMFGYYGEWATQDDGGVNPTNYDADYYHINPYIKYKNFKLTAGYEVMEADATAGVSFSTPLATLHKFNGWTDQFLAAPAGGIEDAYVGLQYKVSGMNEYLDGTVLNFVYHKFDAENGSADYGDEYDVSIKKKFMNNYYIQLKYADFNADNAAPAAFVDTEKFWFVLGANFDLMKSAN